MISEKKRKFASIGIKFFHYNNKGNIIQLRQYGQEFSRSKIHEIDHKERSSLVENLDPPKQTAADAMSFMKYSNKTKTAENDWKISEGASIATATSIFMKQNVTALAVYGKSDEIIGVISQRDFINNLQMIESAPITTSVRDVCTRNVLSVDRKTPINECAKLLSSNPDFPGHHLVVNEKEKGVGLISIQDVLRSYLFQRDAHVSVLLSQYIEDTVELS